METKLLLSQHYWDSRPLIMGREEASRGPIPSRIAGVQSSKIRMALTVGKWSHHDHPAQEANSLARVRGTPRLRSCLTAIFSAADRESAVCTDRESVPGSSGALRIRPTSTVHITLDSGSSVCYQQSTRLFVVNVG